MLPITSVLAIAALACVVAGMVTDLVRFEIPDGLSIALLVLATAYGLLTPGFGWLSHVGAVALVFGAGLFIFSRGWMGGGDIKLLTGIAAWTGLEGLVMQLTATALAGGGLAIVLMMARGIFGTIGTEPEQLPKLFRRDSPLPYAVAIALGTCWWARSAWPIG